MVEAREPRAPTRIRSVDRAARLLMLIATDPNAGWKARTIATEMGTSVPTTYHMLNTLVDAGLVTTDDRGSYCLGVAVARLALAYQVQAAPPRELQVPLSEVAAKTGESAYLSAWRNGEMEVITHVASTQPVRVTDLRPGFRDVAHARAAGKVLLAFGTDSQREHYLTGAKLKAVTKFTVTKHNALLVELEQARVNRYAEEREEFCEGVGCLSVPILIGANLLGAYTVSAPIDRLNSRHETYLQILHDAAAKAGADAEALTRTSVGDDDADPELAPAPTRRRRKT